MLDFDTARDQLIAAALPVQKTETVSLAEGLGRALCSAISSPINVPGFDNSAMDGYALHIVDFDKIPDRFPVTQRIAAGQTGKPLGPNEAARIFTGAPVPQGANVVVPQEHIETADDQIRLTQRIVPSQHIRRLGEDIEAGAVIIAAGTRLTPAHLALAASVGVSTLEVHAKLKVAILFTGDELTEPGQPLAPGAIYNSNRYAIRALLEKLGCEVTDLGIVRDAAQATRDALQHASTLADVIVTCGGVSVGEEDHVKAAVQALGQLNLWQIAMKPGKPLAYGKVGEADFIGLPGNPVSAFVTFVLMARPFLLKRMGVANLDTPSIPAIAGFEWPKPDRRREFLRASFDRNEQGASVLRIWPNQGSGVMSSVAWADGLVDVPPNTVIKKGDTVQYIPFSDLMG